MFEVVRGCLRRLREKNIYMAVFCSIRIETLSLLKLFTLIWFRSGKVEKKIAKRTAQ